ncbi:MAG: hemerythrin domain-containing protein [Dysgonamonadaceae bacterium]|nr:hemerythrin domain-containing protein [Dysgonamonadaceae bacterium]
MSDLICDTYPMLLVMSRFGIALGFGDKTIAEVCTDNKVDTKTFLAVVNVFTNDDGNKQKQTQEHDFSIHALIVYLKKSHSYFLDFKLPSIRRKLIEAIDHSNNDIALAIIRYYDEYVAEVRKHMMYEEEIVFPYVESLLNEKESDEYSIDIFCKKHDDVEAKLAELKNIIIKYYPSKSTNELNNALFDIFSCANDLAYHNRVENKLFVPAIKEAEAELNIKRKK